ncbi:hypothetical protein ACFL42_04880, partial [Candidatus Omnitrophota bacterium]
EFNQIYAVLDPDPSSDVGVDYSKWYTQWALNIMGSVVTTSVDAKGMHDFVTAPSFLAGERVYPRFTYWDKSRKATILQEDAATGGDPNRVSLDLFKQWVSALKLYTTDELTRDVADYMDYLNNKSIYAWIDHKGTADPSDDELKPLIPDVPVFDLAGNQISDGNQPVFDENGEPIMMRWADTLATDKITLADVNPMDPANYEDFLTWLNEQDRFGGLVLGDVLTALKGGEIHAREWMDEETGLFSGVKLYNADGSPMLETVDGVYKDDPDVGDSGIGWLDHIVNTEVKGALKDLMDGYVNYEKAKDDLTDKFLYQYDPPLMADTDDDPSTPDTRVVNWLFTTDDYDDAIYGAGGELHSAYTYDLSTLEAIERADIRDYLERARAIYKYVIDTKRSQARTRFSNRIANANSRYTRVTGSEKSAPQTGMKMKTDLLKHAEAMDDEELSYMLRTVSDIDAGNMTPEEYKNAMLLLCEPGATWPPIPGPPPIPCPFTSPLTESQAYDLRVRLLNIMDWFATPRWIPGAYDYEAIVTDPQDPPTDEELKMRDWLTSKGYPADYQAGLIDYYERKIDQITWSFREERRKLAKKMVMNENSLKDPLNFNYTPSAAFPWDPVNSVWLNADTYLENRIRTFWDKGLLKDGLLGDTAMVEAVMADILSGELLNIFEGMLDVPPQGTNAYDNPKLEHLFEYKTKMEMFLQALKTFDPRDNKREWETPAQYGDFIDLSLTTIPDFLEGDFGQHMSYMAAYSMYLYTEQAMAMIEQLEAAKKQFDIPNLVKNLTLTINSYTPVYAVDPDEKEKLEKILKHNHKYPAAPEELPKPLIELPYTWDITVTDPGADLVSPHDDTVVVTLLYQYESLSEWRMDVLEKLGKYIDENRYKEASYSIPETIRSAAELANQLEKEEASRRQGVELGACDRLWREFDMNSYRPAKQEMLSYTDQKEWAMKTEVTEITDISGSTIESGGDPVHYKLTTYFENDEFSDKVRWDVADDVEDPLRVYRAYSEDVNGNDTIDTGEDLNLNGKIDLYFYHEDGADANERLRIIVLKDSLGDVDIDPATLSQEEKLVHNKVETHIGRFFDDEYMREEYEDTVDKDRDVFDYQEEAAYRNYAAKIGMGGQRLGELYYDIETLRAEKLYENARSYIQGWISEQEYEDNILAIKRYGEAYRSAIEHYLLGTIDKIDISDLKMFESNPEYKDKLYGILEDLTLYMSEEEKRTFIKGQELERLTQRFDSIFEAMVDQYDAATFQRIYLKDATVNLEEMFETPAGATASKKSHVDALSDKYAAFCAAENKIWDDEYETQVIGKYKVYKTKLDNMV